MKNTTYRYRSAITGRFVSQKWAKRHPKTTVREKFNYTFIIERGFVCRVKSKRK